MYYDPNTDVSPNAQTSHLGGCDSHSMDLLHAIWNREGRVLRSGSGLANWFCVVFATFLHPLWLGQWRLTPYMCLQAASCNPQTADGLKLESALKLRTNNPISNASQVLQRSRKGSTVFKVEQFWMQKNSRCIATSGIPLSLAPRILNPQMRLSSVLNPQSESA